MTGDLSRWTFPSKIRARTASTGCVVMLLGAVASAQPLQPSTGAPSPAAAPPPAAVANPPSPAQVGSETIVVEGHARDDARARALREAPFVTIVAAGERRGRAQSIAEVLAATVGVVGTATGGVGSSAYVSVRGAAFGHTGVLFDGISLSRLTSVAVDVGRFQLDELEAVEIFRGNVPAELGGAGVGGAINLVTRVGPGPGGERVWLAAGLGSYGVRRIAGRYGDHLRGVDVTASAGYLHSDGGYRVYSDAGTPLTRADDAWVVRGNSHSTQLDANARARSTSRDDGATAVGARLTWRRHGLPGLVAAPAMHASLASALGLLDVDDQRALGAWSARQRGFALVEWQRFRDRQDEIGLAAQDREYLTLGAGGSSTWRRAFGRHLAQAGVEARAERFGDRDRLMAGAPLRGARQSVALSFGDELAFGAWLINAVVRVDASRTAPAPSPSAGAGQLPDRVELSPSPRVTARLLATSELALKASAGVYVRQPTLVELFGDRGFIVGSPDLRSETGPSLDVGLVWAPDDLRGPIDATLLELAGFYNSAQDAIVFVNTGGVARPTNVGAAENLGVELTARARLWQAVELSLAYTAARSVQRDPERSFDGKDLPRHPRHALFARVAGRLRVADREVRATADLSWTVASYLDRANLQAVPPRRLVSAGVSTELGLGFTLGVDVRNLLDHQVEHLSLDPPPSPELTSAPAAVADVAGLPLPGRTFFLSLEWSR